MKKNIYKNCHCEGAAKRARLRAKARHGRASLIADEAISLNKGLPAGKAGIATLVHQLADSLAMTFRGQMLVELLLAIGLSAIIFPALLTGFIASREAKPQQKQRMLATTLIKETEQAVTSARDMGWASIATFSAEPLHPVISGGRWALVPGAETINGLTRQIVISDVYRDANGAITTSGGTLDPSTKKITSTASWSQPFASSLNSDLYLTRTENVTQTQTTQAHFNAGTKTDLIIEATTDTGIPDDGQIQLATGHGDWCNPSAYLVDTLSLPKPGKAIYAVPGSTDGSPDSAYLGTGDGTFGVSFANISITDAQPPASPEASIIGTYSSSDTTNAVFVNNGYAFLATNATTNQVKIIRLSDNSLYSTIDLGSNLSANGIYVAYDVLYVTSGKNIYTYDVNNIASITQLPTSGIWCGLFGWLCNATTQAEQVVAVGTKVYVTVSHSRLGLQVFSIGIGGVLSRWSVGQLTWSAQAKGLAVNNSGDRTYVAFESTAPPSGFYIINTSQAGRWCILGFCYSPHVGTDYDANGLTPEGMTLATENVALLVGTGGTEQYQVINNLIADNPTRCGGMVITNGANGVAAVSQQDSDVYSYLISGASADQFMIFEGGNGGSSATTGSFESTTIDASYSAAFNRFVANVSQPTGTSVQMQVAVAQAPPPYTSCDGATYTFVGPNGSSGDFFTPNGSTISAQIPLGSYVPSYQNPARCFRYKTVLSTTNTSLTPYFYDVTINYSQ